MGTDWEIVLYESSIVQERNIKYFAWNNGRISKTINYLKQERNESTLTAVSCISSFGLEIILSSYLNFSWSTGYWKVLISFHVFVNFCLLSFWLENISGMILTSLNFGLVLWPILESVHPGEKIFLWYWVKDLIISFSSFSLFYPLNPSLIFF